MQSLYKLFDVDSFFRIKKGDMLADGSYVFLYVLVFFMALRIHYSIYPPGQAKLFEGIGSTAYSTLLIVFTFLAAIIFELTRKLCNGDAFSYILFSQVAKTITFCIVLSLLSVLILHAYFGTYPVLFRAFGLTYSVPGVSPTSETLHGLAWIGSIVPIVIVTSSIIKNGSALNGRSLLMMLYSLFIAYIALRYMILEHNP